MKDSIDYIAYLVKNAKDKNLPKPIIFLGAGASASAGIPLAKEIVIDIKEKFKHNPLIKEFVKSKEMDYYKVMGALTADERRDLFYSYITQEDIKINLTNLYLAQLLKEGYIDFILTVNFDDIILRACALFNFLPPVYDISNVKVPTTSNFREKSVIYLHGQHFGQWLLNEPDELKKVSSDIANIFNEIKNKRTWIVVGYSGQDEIFNQIVKLGSFTSDLFWINYKDSLPSENIMKRLIDKPNINAHLINGYDSDTFFLDLHSQLKLETPEIINKPFSFLKGIMSNVKDISEYDGNNDHKEKYISVKERMEISNSWIYRAIIDIESTDSVEKFKQEIIEAYLKEDYENNEEEFLKKIQLTQYKEAKIELADFYNNWGGSIFSLAKKGRDKKLLQESIVKFETAIKFREKFDWAYGNWGLALTKIAQIDKDKKVYNKSFNKFKMAVEINSQNGDALVNWGFSLGELAELLNEENLFLESFEKFLLASQLNETPKFLYQNWSSFLSKYALLLPFEKREEIYFLAREKAKLHYDLSDNPYNLACSYSLLKNKAEAFKYLDESLSKKLNHKEDILKDPDWDFYKDDEDFIALLGKH